MGDVYLKVSEPVLAVLADNVDFGKTCLALLRLMNLCLQSDERSNMLVWAASGYVHSHARTRRGSHKTRHLGTWTLDPSLLLFLAPLTPHHSYSYDLFMDCNCQYVQDLSLRSLKYCWTKPMFAHVQYSSSAGWIVFQWQNILQNNC